MSTDKAREALDRLRNNAGTWMSAAITDKNTCQECRDDFKQALEDIETIREALQPKEVDVETRIRIGNTTPDEESLIDDIEEIILDTHDVDASDNTYAANIVAFLVSQGHLSTIPEGYVMVPIELTAQDGFKYKLSGEFFEHVEVGDETIKVPVSWSTIKDIHKAMIQAAKGGA